MSIYETFDPKKAPISLLLKGPSGSRKTTKAVQFPRPALVNWDNNLSGLRNLDPALVANLKIVNPHKKDGKQVSGPAIWPNFVSQLEVLCEDSSVGTIIIDSLTTMSEKLLDMIVKSDDPTVKVEIQHWGEFTKYLKWLGDELLCNPNLDKNIIIIAHEDLIKITKGVGANATETTFFQLNVGTRLKNSFGLFFTDVWRCYADAKTVGGTDYRVRVQPAKDCDCKCSLKGLPDDFSWETEKTKVFSQIP